LGLPGHILSRIYNCTKHGNRPTDNAESALLHCTFQFYNCTNCDQLHIKICSGDYVVTTQLKLVNAAYHLTKVAKGSSIYDVHTEGDGGQAQVDTMWMGRGSRPMCMSTHKIKIRVLGRHPVFFSCKEVGVFFKSFILTCSA